MKLRTKLNLAMLSLFAIFLLIGGIGFYSINRLADQSKAVLKANYESLQFVKNLQRSLDKIEVDDSIGYGEFENNLVNQEANITEAGEREATGDIRSQFEQLRKGSADKVSINSIRRSLYKVMDLNMNAILRKSNGAQATAETARIYLAIIGTLCFLLSFSFITNFPRIIAEPVKQLTDGIKQIANKDYSQRIHIKRNDEFGEMATAFNLMAGKLDDYEHSNLAKIIFEKKRIETIINNMKDPVIGFNEKNIILFANTEAIKILGINEAELIGKYGPDVALKNDLLRTLINPDSSIKPIKIYADEKESYFVKELYPITSEEKAIGQVIILSNVTQFKELDLAKTNFIATISHELKTPISSIKMSLKLLDDKRVGKVNEEQKKLIDNISDDTQRLLKITGELLDISQAETGNIKLQKELVEPKAIVDFAYNALKVQAEQKQITIETSYDEALPKINCDLEKTAWVMVNFLSNAIKHSPEKSKVVIKVTSTDNRVTFSVKDSGKGIEDKYKDRVFEKFYQVPNTDTGKSGTGLGLAISKDFITAQGGKIWMKSEIGKGSEFLFQL